MKSIILAAGQGTRLRPITDNRPKCLVELCGKTLLEHQIKVLNQLGIVDIHVVGGYLAEQIKPYDVTLHLNEKYSTTNMVSTLFSIAEEMTGEEDLIISYGDIVFQRNVLDLLISSKAPITLTIDKQWRRYWEARMEDPLLDAETLILNKDNYITELGKVPNDYNEIHGQYTGLIKVSSSYVNKFKNTWLSMDRDHIFDGQTFDNMYMTSFLQYLIDHGWKIKASIIKNGWAEVDCIADLEVANKFWNINL